jgi:hypothetical protein
MVSGQSLRLPLNLFFVLVFFSFCVLHFQPFICSSRPRGLSLLEQKSLKSQSDARLALMSKLFDKKDPFANVVVAGVIPSNCLTNIIDTGRTIVYPSSSILGNSCIVYGLGMTKESAINLASTLGCSVYVFGCTKNAREKKYDVTILSHCWKNRVTENVWNGMRRLEHKEISLISFDTIEWDVNELSSLQALPKFLILTLSIVKVFNRDEISNFFLRLFDYGYLVFSKIEASTNVTFSLVLTSPVEVSVSYKPRIAIIGPTRNNEQFMKRSLDIIESLKSNFAPDSAVVIYENDSTDKTREILLSNKRWGYHFVFENGKMVEKIRTNRIARARRLLWEKVAELHLITPFEYVLMLDMDDRLTWQLPRTLPISFPKQRKNLSWDVICANQRFEYYDIWTLRVENVIEFDCWEEVGKARKAGMDSKLAEQKFVWKFLHGVVPQDEGLFPVKNAFGGAALYRLERALLCYKKYRGVRPDGVEECDHIFFHECIKELGGKIFIDTDMYNA